MTRVNLVDVCCLADQHLFAEWREIKHVPPALARSLRSRKPLKIPSSFVLGEGHVTFFYDKLLWLAERHQQLGAELLRRKYDIDVRGAIIAFDESLQFSPLKLRNYWCPKVSEQLLSVHRIRNRISGKVDWFKFHGQPLTLPEWTDKLHTGVLLQQRKQNDKNVL